MKRFSGGWAAGIGLVLTSIARATTSTAPTFVQITTGNGVESVVGQTISGIGTLFFKGQPGSMVYESQLIGGVWNTQAIPGTANATFAGEVTVGSTTYIGITQPATETVSILSNASGTWQTAFTHSVPSSSDYGSYMRLAAVDGGVVAAYSAAAAVGSEYSTTLEVLDQTATGTFTETAYPVNQNYSIVGISAREVAGTLEVLLGTSGSVSPDILMQRSGGAGTGFTSYVYTGFPNDDGPSLVDYGGKAAFLAVPNEFPDFFYFKSGLPTILPIGKSSSVVVGDDLEMIGGIPTAVYEDRSDSSLHYRQFINGQFNDTVLDTGVAADWPSSVSVFPAADGNVGIAYYTDIGTSSGLKYTEVITAVPEPAVSGLMLGLAVPLARRGPKKSRRLEM